MKIHCAYDDLVKIKDLKPHPKNPNKHSKEQIERLAKVIEYQGIRRPIRISKRSGFITSGHGLSLSLGKLKMESAPVSFQDYDNDEQEFADLVADNSLQSWSELDLSAINLEIPDLGPDFDIDLLGIKDFVIEPADKYGDKDADAVPESRATSILRGDLFQLGVHKLLCGDSTSKVDVERLMNGEKADMVYTDPPYGLRSKMSWGFGDGKQHGKAAAKRGNFKPVEGDDIPFDPNHLFEFDCLKILWGANHYADKLPPSSAWVVWDKRKEGFENDQSDCELAWVSQGNTVRCFRHTWNGMIRDSERGESRVHPTQKPVALAEWCLDKFKHTPEIHFPIIVDLYLGSGSTLIACEKTNRKCFGMEIDPSYCQVIIDRWEKFTGQKAVKLETPSVKMVK